MNIGNIFKNITPAVAVMVAGVLGAYLVYDNYFSGNSAALQVSTFEPAAGEEGAAAAMEGTAAATEAVEGAVEGAAAAAETAKDALGRPVNADGCLLDEMGAVVLDGSTEDPADCVMGEAAPAEGAAATEGATEAVPAEHSGEAAQ